MNDKKHRVNILQAPAEPTLQTLPIKEYPSQSSQKPTLLAEFKRLTTTTLKT